MPYPNTPEAARAGSSSDAVQSPLRSVWPVGQAHLPIPLGSPKHRTVKTHVVVFLSSPAAIYRGNLAQTSAQPFGFIRERKAARRISTSYFTALHGRGGACHNYVRRIKRSTTVQESDKPACRSVSPVIGSATVTRIPVLVISSVQIGDRSRSVRTEEIKPMAGQICRGTYAQPVLAY